MKPVFAQLCRCRPSRFVLALLLSAGIGTSIAAARPWHPTGPALAQDYLQILDGRAQNSIVMLWWVAPPMMQGPNIEAAKEILDRYIVVGVVNASVSSVGTWSFPPTEGPQAADRAGRPLRLLIGDELPPAVQGLIAVLQGTLRQGIGAMGQGMQFYTFDSGTVRACQEGTLSVNYANERYTWATPVPGC